MGTPKDLRSPFLPLSGGKGDVCSGIRTPCYLIDELQLQKNGELLASLSEQTGAKILLAQKAFSDFDFYPLLSRYLAGTEASGLFEARLGFEEMGDREVHVFCTAYREDEFTELLRYADHIVFNSIAQLKKFGPLAKGKHLGLRINPECSTQTGHGLYDPCSPGSRLGVTRQVWDGQMDESTVQMLDGLHFHTLCEQDSDALETTLQAVDRRFGDILRRPEISWINMGGGHHITRPGYDRETLCRCISFAQQSWNTSVYLEPGEAVALNAGFLLSHVLDIVRNGETETAVLDCSAACHMPDVLEMPYLPPLWDACEQEDEEHQIRYRLAGPTCLAGDVIGSYYFRKKLQPGDLLIFGDMAIYTTCKNNTFNGMPLPGLWMRDRTGSCIPLTEFGYQDFKNRLGSRKIR